MNSIIIPERFLEKKKEAIKPIDKNGEGNCCPLCGSKKLIIKKVFSVEQALNYSTGRQIYQTKKTPESYKYECSECSWVSGWFTDHDGD